MSCVDRRLLLCLLATKAHFDTFQAWKDCLCEMGDNHAADPGAFTGAAWRTPLVSFDGGSLLGCRRAGHAGCLDVGALADCYSTMWFHGSAKHVASLCVAWHVSQLNNAWCLHWGMTPLATGRLPCLF